jgi:predicted DNA-binding transcriptional regulator AlpA
MTSDKRKKLRAAKAAEYLEVSRSTLAKWRINGVGPTYHRCGPRIVYYYQDEIDAWQEECDQQERQKERKGRTAPAVQT